MKLSADKYAFGLLRLAMGWIFFWAFIDKLFGLGFATTPENAWIAGGSPTFGFLSFATTGPFAGLYQSLAGNVIVDVLFMLALLVIGVTMILGIGVRIGSYVGMLLSLLMYLSLLLPENNPLIDEHIIYLLVFFLLMRVKAGQWLGLGNRWSRISLVKKYTILE